MMCGRSECDLINHMMIDRSIDRSIESIDRSIRSRSIESIDRSIDRSIESIRILSIRMDWILILDRMDDCFDLDRYIDDGNR